MTKKKATRKYQKSNLKNHQQISKVKNEGKKAGGLLGIATFLFNFFKSLFISIKSAFVK